MTEWRPRKGEWVWECMYAWMFVLGDELYAQDEGMESALVRIHHVKMSQFINPALDLNGHVMKVSERIDIVNS